jgi:Flp pilus assembly protein TadB
MQQLRDIREKGPQAVDSQEGIAVLAALRSIVVNSQKGANSTWITSSELILKRPNSKWNLCKVERAQKKRKEDRKRQNVGWNWEGKSGTHEMSTVFLLFLGAAFLVVAFVVLALAFAVVFAFFAAGAFKCSMNIRIRGRVSMRWIPRI